jgi:hydrogenase maturation factor HypE
MSKIGKWLMETVPMTKRKIYSTIQKNIKYSIAPFYHNIIIQYTDKNPDVARTVVNAITEQLQSTITRQKHLLLYKQALHDATRKRKELGKRTMLHSASMLLSWSKRRISHTQRDE